MAVMQVGPMRMSMSGRRMIVPVCMPHAGSQTGVHMRVVVIVVAMGVLVRHGAVNMVVGVIFEQQDDDTHNKQRNGNCVDYRQ